MSLLVTTMSLLVYFPFFYLLYTLAYENRRNGHISSKNENFKKVKNAFGRDHMQNFLVQIPARQLKRCRLQRACIHTHIHTCIHSDSKETDAPLFYYYMFICASCGSKVSGFQKKKKEKKERTSTTPSCSGPIPAQKSRANSVPGDIFSHLMFEMYLYHFHRFSWEKYTKMIGHMPWLDQ